MSIKRNLIANYSGSAWAALMSLAFAPFYIKLLGAESYGIIGIFTSLVGIMAILDLGLSQAMNREMARLANTPDQEQLIVDTARTLEITYWLIALVVAGIVALLADSIANYWLNPETLSRKELGQALWLISIVIGLRWPIAIYMGGLNGLQRQVVVNILLVIFATIQGVGAVAILWLVSPTIKAFFVWQGVVALLQVIIMRIVLWRGFPKNIRGRFKKQVLHNVWKFAAGITGISVLAVILTQLDKVLLSKLLSLNDFGYYAFASAVAMVVYRLIYPVFTAYYPKLTALVTKGDHQNLAHTFHQGCQLMAVTILPTSLLIAFFSREILAVWTRNPDVVSHSSTLVSLLVIGNAINGLVHMPYALQLSHAWTRLSIYQNIIAVIVLVPSIYFSTQRWGAVGAASVWLILNCGYLLIGIHFMFRRLLKTEKVNWYLHDVGKILLAVLLIMVVLKGLMYGDYGDLTTALLLAISLVLATAFAIISANKLSIRSVFWNK
jgi:O-antigen/teichoic acid export membrane protein